MKTHINLSKSKALSGLKVLSRLKVWAAAVLLTAAVTLAACSPNATKPAADAPVVLKVGNQKGTTRALLTASHALDGAPYTVEWSEFPAAQHLLEALNSGATDVGLVGDAPYLFAFANGSQLKVVSAITYGDGRSTAIIVPENSPIHSLADLKGKRLATGKISVGHYLVLRALEKGGLTTKDVNLVFLAPSDAKAAFASGSIDAWSTWAPFLTTAVHNDKARVLIDGRGLLYPHAYEVATPTAIATKSAQLHDFNARLSKAYAWAAAHPEEYAAALSKDTGLPVDIALAMIKESNISSESLNDKVVSDAADVLQHLSAADGQPKAARPIEEAFAADFRVK